MKKFGLIGGMGPQSTVQYYNSIVYGVHKLSDGRAYPDLTIESIDLNRVVGYCKEKDYDALSGLLINSIRNLACAGAKFAALSANTAHIVFDRVEQQSPIPLISIVDATCREAIIRGYTKLGLLGTIFTMKEDFYKTPFLQNGIEIELPTENEMEFINDKIYNELEFGIIDKNTVDRFIRIIERMKTKHGIEAVILGCTELPMIINDAISPVPCLDTTRLHIDSIVHEILS